jgi:hypothetical protein
MKRPKKEELEFNKFYEISDFIGLGETGYILEFSDCTTGDMEATIARMKCTDIESVCSAIELEFGERHCGEDNFLDTIHCDWGDWKDPGSPWKFHMSFDVNGDHHNDNFTSLVVIGLSNEEDVKKLEAVANKFFKSRFYSRFSFSFIFRNRILLGRRD